MRYRYIGISLIMLFIFSGCYSKYYSEYEDSPSFSKEDMRFMLKTYGNFVSVLPEYKAPMTISCGEVTPINEDLNKETWPFTPLGYELVGSIKTSKNIYIILCREKANPHYPYLYTTTKTGSDIEWKKLYHDTCLNDPFMRRNVSTVIKKDERIEITDSTFYFSKATDINGAPKADSIMVEVVSISISDEGKFNADKVSVEYVR